MKTIAWLFIVLCVLFIVSSDAFTRSSCTWYYLDRNGNVVLEEKCDYAAPFQHGVAVLGSRTYNEVNDNVFSLRLIDKNGQVITSGYSDISTFSEGWAAVYMARGKRGAAYINLNGSLMYLPQFDYGRAFSDGMAAVFRNMKIGYIDRNGRTVIEPQFDTFDQLYDYADFVDGVAIVMKNGKPVS